MPQPFRKPEGNENVEVFGLYDITTAELMLMPKLSYSVADAVSLVAGGQFYDGDPGTLNDLIKDSFNAIYCEIRMGF